MKKSKIVSCCPQLVISSIDDIPTQQEQKEHEEREERKKQEMLERERQLEREKQGSLGITFECGIRFIFYYQSYICISKRLISATKRCKLKLEMIGNDRSGRSARGSRGWRGSGS